MSVDIFNWREWPPLQHILLVRSMSDEKRGINWEGKIGEHIQEDGPGCVSDHIHALLSALTRFAGPHGKIVY